jgi:hypothetical protein
VGKWTVTPGIGASGGGGPVAGAVGQFVIDMGGKKLNSVFAGLGFSVGGPASFTYTDSKTPGYAGDLVVRQNAAPLLPLLKNPPGALMLSIGTAPRHLIPGVPPKHDAIAGGYGLVVVYGVSDTITATTSVALDIAAKAKGWLLTGAYAYAIVATLAKGADAGGIAGMKGTWLFE